MARAPTPAEPAPLQVGLAVGGPATPDAWADLCWRAERGEALGLHSLWVPEGHFQSGATPSPLATLAALAARTHTLRLGTTSLLLPIHHPLRLAEEISTVDRLSGGRLILGLGRGFRRPLFEAFGVEVATKRDRFDEALDAMLAAWRGDALKLDGAHFAMAGERAVHAGLQPLQQPHPPLLVAAFGPKGLRQAGRRALPYLASPLETLPVLKENLAIHREALPHPVEGPGPHMAVIRTVHVAADAAEAARVREALDAERQAVARAPGRTPPALARAAAGAIEERVLVGEAAEVREQVARYREAIGMDLLIARTQVPGCSPAEQRAAFERLPEAVPSA